MSEPLLTRYLQPLLAGRRAECLELVSEALACGRPADEIVCNVVWPAMVQLDRLYRDDRINTAMENMACRINRTVADQLQARLPRRPTNGKRILVCSADDYREELGAEMVADLFQSDGWDVYLVGGGVPRDEIFQLVGQLRPDAMLVFGTPPQAIPETRALIMHIREMGLCPTMNIIVSGGVFNRADGLWREAGADVHADTPREIIQTVGELGPREPTVQRTGLVKKRRRRRKTAVAV